MVWKSFWFLVFNLKMAENNLKWLVLNLKWTVKIFGTWF